MFKKTLIGVGLLLLIFSVGCSNNSVSESSMHSHDISSKYHEKNNNSISEKIDDTHSTEQDYDLDSIINRPNVSFRHILLHLRNILTINGKPYLLTLNLYLKL